MFSGPAPPPLLPEALCLLPVAFCLFAFYLFAFCSFAFCLLAFCCLLFLQFCLFLFAFLLVAFFFFACFAFSLFAFLLFCFLLFAEQRYRKSKKQKPAPRQLRRGAAFAFCFVVCSLFIGRAAKKNPSTSYHACEALSVVHYYGRGNLNHVLSWCIRKQ